MKHPSSLPLFVALVLAGCGGDAGGGSGSTRSAGKDRGAAAMTLGSTQWQAERAKAKIENGKLTIRASNMDMTDGKVKRQELHLDIPDYKGPGDYKTGITGSRFLGVGFDVDAAKAAGEDDKAAADTVSDALSNSSNLSKSSNLSNSSHLMLSNADVKITAASGSEISGTFSWQPPPGLKQPAITNGTFRALLDE